MMRARLAIATLLMLAVVGCAGSSGATTTTRPDRARRASSPPRLNSNTDPCAMRLHDVCAPLLLYYARYQQLPAKAEELAQVPGVTVPELVCPASGKPYLYTPHGPSGPDSGTRIILYDAEPVHAGRRWGVAVQESKPGQALVAKVVVVP